MAELEPDGWWWCAPPTREEIRFRINPTTGKVQQWFTCPHGSWPDLSSARIAHSIDVDEVKAVEA